MDREMSSPLPTSSSSTEVMGPPKTPVSTPGKDSRKRTSSVRKAGSDTEDDDNINVKQAKRDPKTATPTQKKRKAAAKNPLKAMPMGRTYELCADHDKMLIDWKEAGRSWDDIRKKWHEMTGDKTATSTLPNRYSRLKSNFVVIKEEHCAILLEARQEVEASFEREKWNLISRAMEAKGADKYGANALRTQYKRLMEFGAELKTERDMLIQPSTPVSKKKGKKVADGGDEMDDD